MSSCSLIYTNSVRRVGTADLMPTLPPMFTLMSTLMFTEKALMCQLCTIAKRFAVQRGTESALTTTLLNTSQLAATVQRQSKDSSSPISRQSSSEE